ncbi:MAG: peptidylprolyl isomerase [Armatimonadetes bacterium]|nr:peptidylprolyl isomerase [Armatimonadota bacterium]MDE2206697.1 peptidylprolyl isomerase [Armatimonadota bacterium]
MRTLAAIVAIVLGAIALAWITTRLHPGGALPPQDQPTSTTTPVSNKKALNGSQKKGTTSSASPSHSSAVQSGQSHTAGDASVFANYEKTAIHATLTIAGKGSMELELYPEAAPKTVAHIESLIKSGFYDGIKFHRVVPGFVCQAGDPLSKGLQAAMFQQAGVGQHGSGKTVPLEAKLPNLTNTLGLARSSDPDSGDSQFYINLNDNANLDGQYCVFGRVVKGTDLPARIDIGDIIQTFTIP